MDYNATLTIHVNKPATEDDDIDDVMEAFAAYHPAVGGAPARPWGSRSSPPECGTAARA